MNRVAASEYELLTIARGLVGEETEGAVEASIRRKRTIPKTMGPTSARLLKGILAKGTVKTLARRGGWHDRRFVVDGEVRGGRTWSRHPTLELRFSRFTMRLLRWLVSSPMGSTECPALKSVPNTPADHLMLYLAVDLLERLNCAEQLLHQKGAKQSPLVWLGFPNLYGMLDIKPELSKESFSLWATGTGSALVEALTDDLADRWMRMEWRKSRVFSGQHMRGIGTGQSGVLNAFLPAVKDQARPDLAAFLIFAAKGVLAPHVEARNWVGRLEARGTMRERSEARRQAGAFLRSIHRMSSWAQEASGVRFFDDDYDAAQLFLSLWEQVGEDRLPRAERIIKNLEALDAAVAQDQTGMTS